MGILHKITTYFGDLSNQRVTVNYVMNSLPGTQNFEVQLEWQFLIENHTLVDYMGNLSDGAVEQRELVAEQLAMLSSWVDRNQSGSLELDPSRHQTLPQGSGKCLLQHKFMPLSSTVYSNYRDKQKNQLNNN